jgi:hypothetical protein
MTSLIADLGLCCFDHLLIGTLNVSAESYVALAGATSSQSVRGCLLSDQDASQLYAQNHASCCRGRLCAHQSDEHEPAVVK